MVSLLFCKGVFTAFCSVMAWSCKTHQILDVVLAEFGISAHPPVVNVMDVVNCPSAATLAGAGSSVGGVNTQEFRIDDNMVGIPFAMGLLFVALFSPFDAVAFFLLFFGVVGTPGKPSRLPRYNQPYFSRGAVHTLTLFIPH